MNEDQLKNVKQLGKFILIISGGAVIGYFIGKLLKGDAPENPVETVEKANKWLMILGIFISFFIVLFVHEMGHIIGGLLGGDKFGFIIVGPLKVERKESRLQFGWNTNMSFFGGLAMTYPQTTDNFKQRRTMTVAGGPLASLILALVAYVIYTITADTFDINIHAQLWTITIMSGFIFVVTSIPMKSGGFMSDGMQLMQIYKGNSDSKSYEAVLQLIALSQSGQRPRDIDAHWYDQASSPTSNSSIEISGYFYQYYRYLDKGNWEEAYNYVQKLEDSMDNYPEGFQYMLQGEIVFMEAYHQKNTEKANALWEKIAKKIRKDDYIMRYRIEAALALLNDELDNIHPLVNKGLAKQKTAIDAGSAKMEVDILRLLAERRQDLQNLQD